MFFMLIFKISYADDSLSCPNIGDELSSQEAEKYKNYLSGELEHQNEMPTKGIVAGMIGDYKFIKSNQHDQQIVLDAFYIGLIKNDKNYLEQLLPLLKDINAHIGNVNPLLLSVYCNRPEMVKKILSMGGDVNSRTKNLAHDALILAVLTENESLVDLLIESDINCKKSRLYSNGFALKFAKSKNLLSIYEKIVQCTNKG